MSLTAVAIVLGFPLAATSIAAAEPGAMTPAPPQRGWGLGAGLVAGLGTPIGNVGLEATVAPLPWLVIAGGLGENGDGRQAALSVRARSTGTFGVFAGAGLAGGHFAAWYDNDFDPPRLAADGRALWSTFEIGFEIDGDNVSFRTFAGIKLLDDHDAICYAGSYDYDPCGSGGYAGVALDVHGR